MDDTRKSDLEMLEEARQNANSTAERERYEEMAYKISNVSSEVVDLREDLVGAVRSGDKKGIEQMTNKIHEQKLRETNGHSIGNVKGEEIDKHVR